MNRLTRLALTILGASLFVGCSFQTQPGNPLAYDFFLSVAGITGLIATIAGLVTYD